MIRTPRLAAILTLCTAVAACESDPDIYTPNSTSSAERFTATLSGTNESPAVSTTASGNARIEITPDGSIVYYIDVQNLTAATQAHIHGPAAAGQNAGVIVFLGDTRTAPATLAGGRYAAGQILRQTAALPAAISYDSLLTLIRNGNAYVNVHTSRNPGGEIRGQIVRQP